MCAFRNRGLVSLCDATHWRRASTLQALLEVLLSKSGGERSGYTETISCRSAAIVPTECQMKGASSEKCSRYLDNSSRALSRFSAYFNSSICLIISFFSCSDTPEFIIKEMLPIYLKITRRTSLRTKKRWCMIAGFLACATYEWLSEWSMLDWTKLELYISEIWLMFVWLIVSPKLSIVLLAKSELFYIEG